MTDEGVIVACAGREEGEEGERAKRKKSFSSDDENYDLDKSQPKVAKPSIAIENNEGTISGAADMEPQDVVSDSDSEMEEEEVQENNPNTQSKKSTKQTKKRGPHPRTPENRRCEFPVIMKDEAKPDSPITLTGMGIKLRTKSLENQFGPLATITQTRNDSFLIGCTSKIQQAKVAKCKNLVGGIPISCRIPTPWTEGVVYGISPSEKNHNR